MQRNVLADLALESEAAMLGAFRVARATDGLQTSEHERLLARVATPVVKFWNCQRAPAFTYECLQVHGGNGFIMENAMARLYREAPLNSIWEGTSNMMCMDVLRAMQRDARCRDAFIDELRASRGLNRDLRQERRTISPIGCMRDIRTTGMRGRWSPGWRMPCRRPRCCSMAMPQLADLFVQSRLRRGGGARVRHAAIVGRTCRHRRARIRHPSLQGLQ